MQINEWKKARLQDKESLEKENTVIPNEISQIRIHSNMCSECRRFSLFSQFYLFHSMFRINKRDTI